TRMKHADLTAEPRTVLGNKVARLRRSGKLPANIYGRNVPSTAITLDTHDFELLYRHLLPTTVIDLRVDGQMRPVLLAKADVNPRTGQLVHIEFKQVNLREKVHASVSVVGVGRSELMSRGEAILLQSLDAIEVSALPDDLPPNVEVDLAALIDFGAAIHVGDLPLDHSKIDLLTPRDELVFKLTPPQRREEELEAEAVEEAEGAAEEAEGAAEEA
ncbi:MAG TPA: 50S ribosomal protein L25, partial [Chloroflexota bacterium]|nr:50S ribosomal protein L25 [Chloroflexota bacterium]